MASNSLINVWFYVDPEAESINAVICWFPLGMSIRQDSTWTITTKEESGVTDMLTNSHIYALNWESDELLIDENFDFDDPENEHIAVKEYDKGTLTLESLKKYSDLVYSGPQGEFDEDLEIED